MNLILFYGTELDHWVTRGEFFPAPGKERLLEIRSQLENLEPRQPMVFDTTHPTNIGNGIRPYFAGTGDQA